MNGAARAAYCFGPRGVHGVGEGVVAHEEVLAVSPFNESADTGWWGLFPQTIVPDSVTVTFGPLMRSRERRPLTAIELPQHPRTLGVGRRSRGEHGERKEQASVSSESHRRFSPHSYPSGV